MKDDPEKLFKELYIRIMNLLKEPESTLEITEMLIQALKCLDIIEEKL